MYTVMKTTTARQMKMLLQEAVLECVSSYTAYLKLSIFKTICKYNMTCT